MIGEEDSLASGTVSEAGALSSSVDKTSGVIFAKADRGGGGIVSLTGDPETFASSFSSSWPASGKTSITCSQKADRYFSDLHESFERGHPEHEKVILAGRNHRFVLEGTLPKPILSGYRQEGHG